MTVAAQEDMYFMTERGKRDWQMMKTAIGTLDEVALLRVALANK